jgi:hypothetical protein
MVLSATIPAAADVWDSTMGSLATTQAGIDYGYQVEGKGRMTRFAEADKTVAKVRVSGLTPRRNYPVRVHSGTCSDVPAGGAVYGGFSSARVTTDRDGYGEESSHYTGIAGADARTIVVYDYANPTVAIGCADLK